MSVEVKKVKEEIKIKSEGLTLKELGLTIPSPLVEKGWDHSTGINRLYKSPGKEFSESIFAVAIEHGFFDFALEIIKTADRPDKLGFDPNFPVVVNDPSVPAVWAKTPVPYSPLCWVVVKHTIARYDGLHQVVDALISRGATLSFAKFKEYYQSKGIQIGACDLRDANPFAIIFGKNYVFLSDPKEPPYDRANIDKYVKTTPMMHRIFAEYWMQLEYMIQGDKTVTTADQFKEIINKSMLIGARIDLPGPIFDIIYSYLSTPIDLFVEAETNRKVRNAFEKYYVSFRNKKDAEFKEKMEKIKADEKLEDERRQQKKETQAPVIPHVPQGPKVDFESMVVKQNAIIIQMNAMMQQQNEMIRTLQGINQSQTQQIAQLMGMFQGFTSSSGAASLGQDARGAQVAATQNKI